MAAIPFVGDEALNGIADKRLRPGNDGRQCVAIVGRTRQRLHMGDKLAALGVRQGGCHGDFHAKIIGLVRLALGPRLDRGCTPRPLRRVSASTSSQEAGATPHRRTCLPISVSQSWGAGDRYTRRDFRASAFCGSVDGDARARLRTFAAGERCKRNS